MWSPNTHYVHKILQVDKLKVLSDSLSTSSSKAEQRIMDHRFLGAFLFYNFVKGYISFMQDIFYVSHSHLYSNTDLCCFMDMFAPVLYFVGSSWSAIIF